MQDNIVKNAVKTVEGNGGREYKAIKDDIVTLKDDAMTLAHDIKSGSKAVAREGLDTLYAAGETEFQKVEERVRKNPGQSVLIAFAAGFAASYLLGSRR